MNNLPNKNIALVFQSFAIFIAFAILLGRIYSLRYFDVLGVPRSELSLELAQYSVVSLDTTIIALAFAVIPALYIWRLHATPESDTLHKWKLGLGWLLVAIGIALSIEDIRMLINARLEDNYSGLFGLYHAVLLIVLSLGLILVYSSVPIRNEPGIILTRSWRITVYSFLILIMFAGYFTSALNASVEIAEIDANNTLRDAPHADIQLKSSSEQLSHDTSADNCQPYLQSCRARLVMIGDAFVYFDSPEDHSSSISRRQLYAVPVSQIALIVYTPKEVK